MAPKIQEEENVVVNNNNKGDSPKFKLNIEDTTNVHRNAHSNSTNNRWVLKTRKIYKIQRPKNYNLRVFIFSQFSSMSDEESYECYGEGDMDTSSPNNALTKWVLCFVILFCDWLFYSWKHTHKFTKYVILYLYQVDINIRYIYNMFNYFVQNWLMYKIFVLLRFFRIYSPLVYLLIHTYLTTV